ncbi:MAG: hypothetical protein Q9207_003365 [Kuettlingeria erythrocarpa]
MATTPPKRAIVAHTPPTPLHGPEFDNPSNHKSTRQSSRRPRRVETTSPPASTIHPSASSKHIHNLSPPSSTPGSTPARGIKRRRGNLNGNTNLTIGGSPISTGTDMESFANTSDGEYPEPGTLHLGPYMLPTPAKTPCKKDLRKTAEIQSAARVLFPIRLENVEEAMPTKKSRRARKNVGFALDGPGENEEPDSRIQIFTDSKEKLPELDLSESNPFIDRPGETESLEPQNSTGRRGRSTPVKTDAHIENTFNHEKGMIYVLTHTVVARKYTDPSIPILIIRIRALRKPTLGAPLNRAFVLPHAQKQRRERELAEEEAPTDIEDYLASVKEGKPTTPMKQSFSTGPATPPTTGHATRSATRKAALTGGNCPLGPPAFLFKETATAIGRRPRQKSSPFDSWQRTKGKKRGFEQADGVVDAGSKRLRYNTSA